MNVTARYDPASIRALFDDMAATYGYVNLISSFGFCVRWRRQALTHLPLGTAGCVLDLMSGMGEFWRSLAKSLPPSARVMGVDLSPQMVRRARRDWSFAVEICLEDVLEWAPGENIADVVVSSFGLKTFDRDQQQRLAARVAGWLKPGGILSFVEISVPPSPLLRPLYMFYLNRMIPWIGRLLLGNPDCYRMLGIYTRAFGDVTHFASCLKEAGLDVENVSYFLGCATGVRGKKPPNAR